VRDQNPGVMHLKVYLATASLSIDCVVRSVGRGTAEVSNSADAALVTAARRDSICCKPVGADRPLASQVALLKRNEEAARPANVHLAFARQPAPSRMRWRYPTAPNDHIRFRPERPFEPELPLGPPASRSEAPA
jgi:hypothetical protein